MEKNTICHPITSPECPVSPLANYELNARIVANNAPADGASFNGVHYTLSSPVDLPVANQQLEISTTGSATLIVPTYYTNNSGVLDVALLNTVPETVELYAYLAADTSVNTHSFLTFIPVGPAPTYELISTVLIDNARADGNSQNAVMFYLTYGGTGVSGTILISDFIPSNPPVSRTTGTDGRYTAYFTSSNPGSFNVSAQLRSDPSVSTSETITFTPVVTYPVFLGSNRVPTPRETNFLGVEPFFGPLVITAGHRYSIRGIPTSGLFFGECPNSYVFNDSSQQCRLDITSDFTLLAVDSLTPIRALNSGVGRELHSPGYYFNGYSAQEFTVDVYDLGPE
ncbi:Ig-like domain-containing protein [Sodalis ligni]|jgi:hypothetical protein|uniref:Big-1 domain-containing protein n=1 Tax=Sodalis ligni TaxID=2697027 RepID=A0A4R1NHE2_9GAMM|nr:hypothetical protein [Sodalis ligni]TCL05241.1 hypothetical protein EZJ58_3415 [Sodalis ligni]